MGGDCGARKPSPDGENPGGALTAKVDERLAATSAGAWTDWCRRLQQQGRADADTGITDSVPRVALPQFDRVEWVNRLALSARDEIRAAVGPPAGLSSNLRLRESAARPTSDRSLCSVRAVKVWI